MNTEFMTSNASNSSFNSKFEILGDRLKSPDPILEAVEK